MDAPGLPVELMLKQVTNRVVARTKGRQEPWIEGSLRGTSISMDRRHCRTGFHQCIGLVIE